MTTLLLDTHALIWWWLDDPRMSGTAREALENEKNRIVVSSVSVYEIANRHRLGRLPALGEILADLDAAINDAGFAQIPLSPRHAARAGLLRGEHRDPFDRMIAAQGLIEQMPIVTRDREIAGFGCMVLW